MGTVIKALIPALLHVLTPDIIRKGVGAFIEVVEDECRKTKNTYDDAIVLPICGTIREALNVPDETPGE